MFFRLRRWLAVSRYDFAVRSILNTPPLVIDPASPYVLVSQICRFDVRMWIVAGKSWARFCPPKRVVLLDDGSLRSSDRALLHAHVPGLRIVGIPEVENEACPRGSCWERLLLISELVEDDYVMQLDSDTVTLAPPEEAARCIEERAAFTLASDYYTEIGPILEAHSVLSSRDWTPSQRQHVQVVSESAFDRLPEPEGRRYVRGNAAFAGFPRGSFDRGTVERFSGEMQALIGAKWSDWGSEQVTSNYVIANIPGARMLGAPRYAFHTPSSDLDAAIFIHFIGSHRFENGTYARLSKRVAAELGAG